MEAGSRACGALALVAHWLLWRTWRTWLTWLMTHKAGKPPADDVLAALAVDHDTCFLALESKSYMVSMFRELAGNISGLTAKAFVPSIIAATDCVLGPVKLKAITEVNSDGEVVNEACTTSSAQTANVAVYVITAARPFVCTTISHL